MRTTMKMLTVLRAAAGGSAPVANFSADVTTIDAGGTVNFTDLSTNTPTSWSWSFGDTGTSTQQHPSHQYEDGGVYDVELIATNASGSDTETKVGYIGVRPVVPSQSSPVDAAMLTDYTPTFNWIGVVGATSYDIQIASDSGFSTIVDSATVNDPTYTPASDLTYSRVFYWRVRSKNAAGDSAWSSTRTFGLWLLHVEFATDDAEPLTNPYAGEVGSLTVVDTGNKYKVLSSELVPVGSSTATLDPRLYGAALARVAGRTVCARVKRYSTFGTDPRGGRVGWIADLTDANKSDAFTSASGTGSNIKLAAQMYNTTFQGRELTLVANDVFAEVAVVQRENAGCFYFADGKLVWVSAIGAPTPNYPVIYGFDAGRRMFGADYLAVKDLGSPFDAEYGIADVHDTSADNGADYVGTADGIFDLVITAPNPLAGSAGLKFRKSGTNYWKVWLDNTGALLVQRFASDVGQGSPTTLATGVITAGATRTIRVIAISTLLEFYSLNNSHATGTQWLRLGSGMADSVLNANTGLSPVIDSGSWILGQIDSYPNSSAEYDNAFH